MKRAIMLPGLLAIILIVAFLLRIGKPRQVVSETERKPTQAQTPAASRVLKTPQQQAGIRSDVGTQLQGVLSPASGYKWNPKQEAEHKRALPFKLLGVGTESARVVDDSGKILIASTKTQGVYGLDVSPNKKRFVVALGDGKSRVVDSQSGLVIDLPASPGVQNMVGFSSWRWLSDDLLITTSGTQAMDGTGKPLNCCEGHNLSSTQMFAFRISTHALSPVSKPESVSASVFEINRVSSDGRIEIITDETHLAPSKAVGWYQVLAK